MLKRISIFLLVFTPLFFYRAGVFAQEIDERQKLVEQQKALSAKIEALKREQDFLLFHKELYNSDSKYLLLDFSAGKCELKYRNRILKSVRFTSSSKLSGRMSSGAIALTKKAETPAGKRTLIFGDALIIQVKRSAKAKAAPEDMNIPRISIARKDMASLFYAVEKGSMAYIVR